MARSMLRRLGYALAVLLLVSLLVFFLMALLPGDYVRAALAGSRVSPDFAEGLRRVYGLDVPAWQRYLHWLSAAVRGDLGYSFSHGRGVLSVITSALPVTLLVGGVAFALELLFGICLGCASAWRAGRTVDRLGVAFSLLSVSLPPFVLAIFLQKWLVLDLRLLPLSGLSTPGTPATALDVLPHLVLPCLTLALLEAGRLSRYVRASMVEVLASDYVRAARAGGIGAFRFLRRYALRNALLPVVTYLGLSLPVLFGGALVIETVFSLPGLGLASYNAVLARDYPLVMGITMLVCLVTVAGNLLADLLYRAADPRVRVGKGAQWT